MAIHSSYIRYFNEVRNCGSIRKAAAKLHVAPSAVSRQMLKLEGELEISLFERQTSGIKLTQAGELFAAHVSHTLSESDQLIEQLKALKNRSHERIAIAAQESVIAQFLPKVLLEFHDQYPGVLTSFTTASGKDLIDLIAHREMDIALAFDPAPQPEIKQLVSQALPVVAVMTPNHPLANTAQLELAQCAEYPLILPDSSWPLRDIIDDLFSKLDQAPRVLTSSNSVEFLRKMLATDMIIGFQTVIGIEAQIKDGKLVQIPLLADQSTINQQFALCVRSDAVQTEAFIFLLKLLKKHFDQYQTAT